MKIKITQEHIDKGKQGYCHTCPIALAIKAALQITNLMVYSGFVAFTADGYHNIDLPNELHTIIRHFDQTGEMKPFEFELNYEN